MAAIRSITKVVFSLILISLLFDASLLYPLPVVRLKGIGYKGYVKAAARLITRLFTMEKASKDPRMLQLTSAVASV